MISNAPGTVSDIVTEEYRALAFSIWSIGPMNGPVTGPLIGGFAAQYLGWRWTNWLVMIFGGVGWIMCSLIKETYGPTLLKKKAAKMRKETGDDRWWCRYDERNSGMYKFILHVLNADKCSDGDFENEFIKAICVVIYRADFVVLERLYWNYLRHFVSMLCSISIDLFRFARLELRYDRVGIRRHWYRYHDCYRNRAFGTQSHS